MTSLVVDTGEVGYVMSGFRFNDIDYGDSADEIVSAFRIDYSHDAVTWTEAFQTSSRTLVGNDVTATWTPNPCSGLPDVAGCAYRYWRWVAEVHNCATMLSVEWKGYVGPPPPPPPPPPPEGSHCTTCDTDTDCLSGYICQTTTMLGVAYKMCTKTSNSQCGETCIATNSPQGSCASGLCKAANWGGFSFCACFEGENCGAGGHLQPDLIDQTEHPNTNCFYKALMEANPTGLASVGIATYTQSTLPLDYDYNFNTWAGYLSINPTSYRHDHISCVKAGGFTSGTVDEHTMAPPFCPSSQKTRHVLDLDGSGHRTNPNDHICTMYCLDATYNTDSASCQGQDLAAIPVCDAVSPDTLKCCRMPDSDADQNCASMSSSGFYKADLLETEVNGVHVRRCCNGPAPGRRLSDTPSIANQGAPSSRRQLAQSDRYSSDPNWTPVTVSGPTTFSISQSGGATDWFTGLVAVEPVKSRGAAHPRVAAAMSSDVDGTGTYAAANAIDGDTAEADGSIAHSVGANGNGADNQWLMIDMGASYTVYEVEIYNRPDCCQFRLSWDGTSNTNFGYEIVVSNTASDPVTSAIRTCAFNDPTKTASVVTHICEAAGRYVYLRLPGSNRLVNIAEMYVYASTTSNYLRIGEAPSGLGFYNYAVTYSSPQPYTIGQLETVAVGLTGGFVRHCYDQTDAEAHYLLMYEQCAAKAAQYEYTFDAGGQAAGSSGVCIMQPTLNDVVMFELGSGSAPNMASLIGGGFRVLFCTDPLYSDLANVMMSYDWAYRTSTFTSEITNFDNNLVINPDGNFAATGVAATVYVVGDGTSDAAWIPHRGNCFARGSMDVDASIAVQTFATFALAKAACIALPYETCQGIVVRVETVTASGATITGQYTIQTGTLPWDGYDVMSYHGGKKADGGSPAYQDCPFWQVMTHGSATSTYQDTTYFRPPIVRASEVSPPPPMVGGHTPLILQTGWDTSYAGWPYQVGECSGVASSDTAAYPDEAQAVAACMALPYSDCAMIFMQIQIGVGGTTQIHRYLRGPSTTYVNNVACATLLNGYSYFRPPDGLEHGIRLHLYW